MQSINNAQSLLWIKRPSRLAGSGLTVEVKVDGTMVGILKDGYMLPPLTVTPGKQKILFDAAKSKMLGIPVGGPKAECNFDIERLQEVVVEVSVWSTIKFDVFPKPAFVFNQWEYCEIEVEPISETNKARYWAKAIGSHGFFVAGYSQPFWSSTLGYLVTPPIKTLTSSEYGMRENIPDNFAESINAVNQLTSTLIMDGWECIASPNDNSIYWKKHFRRPISA